MSHFYFLFTIVFAFILVVITIPPIVRVASIKKLFDKQDDRKIHERAVPALGGIAIFIGFTLSILISTKGFLFKELQYIIAGTIFVFFIGLKDDLVTVPNKMKFVVQILAALMLIILADLRLTNFHGFLGLHHVNYFMGFVATLFLMLLTVNAYNLIDGIDGLASGLALMASFAFGIFFIFADEYLFAIISFALAGSLFGFFIYNVFGTTNKLFMGDTGSLVTGLVISAILIRFNNIDSAAGIPAILQETPALSFAIVLIPLVDTLRVFGVRMINGKSPFAPDTNHVHHRLLRIYNNHLKVTLTIILTNVVFVCFAITMAYFSLNINLQFLILITFALVAMVIPAIIIKKWEKHPKRVVVKI